MESAKGNSEVGTKELAFKDESRNAPSPMNTIPLIGTTETYSAVGTTGRTKELSSTDGTTQALSTIESEVVLLTTGTSVRSVVMEVQKSASVKTSLLNGYIPEAQKPLAAAATVAAFWYGPLIILATWCFVMGLPGWLVIQALHALL